MKICVILRCSGKVLQSQSVLNGDQKSSLRLQISAHTLKKCLVRSFSLGKAHGILQHTVYYHIVEFSGKVMSFRFPTMIVRFSLSLFLA